MPWCEGCNRYLSSPTVKPDGSCPECGRPVGELATAQAPKAPWHFKLIAGAAAAYLVMRGVQGVAWVVEQIR